MNGFSFVCWQVAYMNLVCKTIIIFVVACSTLWLVLPHSGHTSSSIVACKAPPADVALTYAAPRYFPFPPFRIALETKPGLCDLGAPAFNFTPRVVSGNRKMTVPLLTRAERLTYCKAFEKARVPRTGNQHTTLMPEPFIVQVISSTLGHCPYCDGCCHAIDIGANVGYHASYMAALGASVDAVEASTDMAAALKTTVRANCWDSRVRVLLNAITADEDAHGKSIEFQGGWRRDDPTMERRQRHSVELFAIQKLLQGRRVHLLKIDIDNSEVELQLLLVLRRMIAAHDTQVDAIVVELSSAPARRRSPKARKLARALSYMQMQSGYHIYRLAHHLHSMATLEPWYSPCVGVRTITYMLHVKQLNSSDWLQLLELRTDRLLGRSDTASFLLTTVPMGRGAEGNWRSESMDKSLPNEWRNYRCGA